SRQFEHALSGEAVPFQLVRGLEFFKRKEIKDVVAYLQLICNPRDTIAFMRVVNEPRRGIGKTTVGKIVNLADELGISVLEAAKELTNVPKITGVSAKVKKALADFVKMIEELSQIAGSDEYSIESLTGMVLDRTGYRKQYELDTATPDTDEPGDASNDEDARQRLDNIEEFLTEAREFDRKPFVGTGDDFDIAADNSLQRFLEQIALVNDVDSWEDDTNRVSLMTLHAAKGLEFPVVYIVAVEEGILPHERTRDFPQQIEEERRLFFVGMTRAREELRISWSRYREYRGRNMSTIASSFLFELPKGEIDSTSTNDLDDDDCFVNNGNENAYDGVDTEIDYDTVDIDYDAVDIEYDENGQVVNPSKKRKKQESQKFSLTTAAELLKKLHRL
ncbi:MAG: ATP-dependent helicase, partial [Thermoguttaceae bacterium]